MLKHVFWQHSLKRSLVFQYHGNVKKYMDKLKASVNCLESGVVTSKLEQPNISVVEINERVLDAISHAFLCVIAVGAVLPNRKATS